MPSRGQFRLRSMMAVVAVVAVGLALLVAIRDGKVTGVDFPPD